MGATITLSLDFVTKSGTQNLDVILADAIIGGWTGRDKAAMEHHIEELVKIGVARPETTPLYYRVSVSRLTTKNQIQALGDGSGGEVEYVMLAHEGRILIGAGSDHTDRKYETNGISLAKQMCDKPIATTFWPYDEVQEHWDQLIVRSYATINGERELYQEGTVAAMLPAEELLAGYSEGGGRLADNTLMFGGTIGAINGVRPTERFEFELEDPVLERKIAHIYDVVALPDKG